MRISITRRDGDGSTVEGTAEVVRTNDRVVARDFRDSDGKPLVMPAGSSLRYAWPAETGPEEDEDE